MVYTNTSNFEIQIEIFTMSLIKNCWHIVHNIYYNIKNLKSDRVIWPTLGIMGLWWQQWMSGVIGTKAHLLKGSCLTCFETYIVIWNLNTKFILKMWICVRTRRGRVTFNLIAFSGVLKFIFLMQNALLKNFPIYGAQKSEDKSIKKMDLLYFNVKCVTGVVKNDIKIQRIWTCPECQVHRPITLKIDYEICKIWISEVFLFV